MPGGGGWVEGATWGEAKPRAHFCHTAPGPDKNTWRAEVLGAWCLGGKVAGWLFLAGYAGLMAGRLAGLWMAMVAAGWLLGWLCWLMAGWLTEGSGSKSG